MPRLENQIGLLLLINLLVRPFRSRLASVGPINEFLEAFLEIFFWGGVIFSLGKASPIQEG